MKNNRSLLIAGIAILVSLLASAAMPAAPLRQADNTNPPDHVVKLIFIHHSTGGNWLADPAGNELGGDLGRALMENNYYVSATNYGWGPDSIGDATDIPNWLDWFRSDNSTPYMNALYNENGQNIGDFGDWPRLSSDPGGENEIILFKSCFPNSALEGSPSDPPDPEGWLSVGHAKYVYNEILQYFQTRPDKLFVVITAPPLSEGTYAANARAFNNWLVNDWLAENNYPYNNVAVFDFYNLLTGKDAHHRYNNGQIEHITSNRNTLYYPSGDDHPSAQGNQKATTEFIPLLNIFYNRWQAGSAQLPPVQPPSTSGGGDQSSSNPVSSSTGAAGLIADFEGGGSTWESFRDEATQSSISCAPANGSAHGGSAALQIDFNIVAGSWGTCVSAFDSVQDWRSGNGLLFYLNASQAGLPYNVILTSGTAENPENYIAYQEAPADSANGWATIEIPWDSFTRAAWEADGGTPFTTPERIQQVGFGFDGLENSANAGSLRVDDLSLLGTEAAAVEEMPQTSPEGEEPNQPLPCLGSLLLPLAFVGMTWVLKGMMRKLI